MQTGRFQHSWGLRWLIPAVAVCLIAPGAVEAQTNRWVVDPDRSLAWWQIDPHLNHLWATTCPEEPSWAPGEGRSAGWSRTVRRPPGYTGYANKPSPPEHIPLYPRGTVTPVCTRAVTGTFVMDTVAWNGVQGHVAVLANALITGETRRDAVARNILDTNNYPQIRFSVDRLADVQPGDTLRGTVLGTFELRGVQAPMRVPVKAWREAGGLRVVGQFKVPASDLVDVYEMSRWKLGLGVGTWIWHSLFMGIDAVLHPIDD